MPAWAGLVLAMLCSGGVLAVYSQEKSLCLDALQPQVQARYGFLHPHGGDATHTAEQGDAAQLLQDHVLYASYDFDIPKSDSQSENDTESNEQNHRSRVEESGGSEGQSAVEDVLKVDFTLLSGRVLLPGWWACGGSGDTVLTVALVGGNILEDSDKFSEDVREKYGDIFYFINLKKAKEKEIESAGDAFNLSSPASGAWEALEELRWLWHTPHATHWAPHHASALTHPRYNPAATSPPHEPKGALPPSESASPTATECLCDTDCEAYDGGSSSGGASSRPYEQFFTPSNVSADVFPGCLHPQVLTHHLRAPSASHWHAYRYAVDHHMHLTGIPRFPTLAAATYHLAATSCLVAPRPSGTHRLSPGDAAAGGRVALDVTVLLQSWLDEVSPWRRRTSKITFLFFKSEPDRGDGGEDRTAGAGQQQSPSPTTTPSTPSDITSSGCHTYSPVLGDATNTTRGPNANSSELPPSTSPRLSFTYTIDGKWTEPFVFKGEVGRGGVGEGMGGVGRGGVA